MAVRHRIPTIFSIYMVDVLCCAMGCVILLWQVSYQEAEDRNLDLTASLEKLKSAKLSIESLTSEVDGLKIDLDTTRKKEVQVTLALDDTRKSLAQAEKLALVRKKEYDDLRETHTLALAVLEKLRGQYKDLESMRADLEKKNTQSSETIAVLEKKNTQTASDLAARLKANAELLLKIAEAEKKAQSLEKDLTDRQTAATSAGKKIEEQAGQLKEAERLAKLLGSEKLELLSKVKTNELRARLLEAQLASTQGDMTQAQKKIADLLRNQGESSQRLQISVKDLETAQAALALLRGENQDLIRRAGEIKKAAENRFAGITLTGQKVVFMVDMSGSMELIDGETPEPDKWPLVCDTVARLMQSLSDLKQYQVILFSDKVSYAVGKEGQWLDYSGNVDAVYTATRLKQIKPKGATDMYAAFQEAFRFRPQGADTIYVLSDGLPNAGAGMPTNAGSLTEQQITTALSKHVRNKLKIDWNRPIANQSRVKINTIGFFYESPEVGAFLWALAREHEGSFVGMSRP